MTKNIQYQNLQFLFYNEDKFIFLNFSNLITIFLKELILILLVILNNLNKHLIITIMKFIITLEQKQEKVMEYNPYDRGIIY